ncbi:hypothetical protein BDQ17DRAFT_1540233 [Cyathus striatus]|nr:hypothetical protein BDQ17DRAFT_1540233 [Cyathus striatus]
MALVAHPHPTRTLGMLKVLIHLPKVKFYIERKDVTVPIVEGILGLNEGEGVKILRGLQAIVYLHDGNQRVGLYDPSFTAFLKDPERSGNFYVGEDEGAVEVSKWCVDSFISWKKYQSRISRPQKAHLNRLRTVLGAPTDNDDWVTKDTRRYTPVHAFK